MNPIYFPRIVLKTTNSRRLVLPHCFYKEKYVEVLVSSDRNEISEWIREYIFENKYHTQKVVGFDAEWGQGSFSFQKDPISIVQLGIHDKALLVQMSRQSGLPNEFYDLFSSRDILKVGNGILDDLYKLKADYNISFNHFLDIGLVLQRFSGHEGYGLLSLSTYFFGNDHLINKSKDLTRSNWNKKILSLKQIRYAAYDAVAAHDIYKKFKSINHLEENSENDIYDPNWLSKHLRKIIKLQETADILPELNLKNLILEADIHKSDLTGVQYPYLILSLKELQKIVRLSSESSFCREQLLERIHDIDEEWFEAHSKMNIPCDGFWRISLTRYAGRIRWEARCMSLESLKFRLRELSIRYEELAKMSIAIPTRHFSSTKVALTSEGGGRHSDEFTELEAEKRSLQIIIGMCREDAREQPSATQRHFLLLNEVCIDIFETSNHTQEIEDRCRLAIRDFISVQRKIEPEVWLDTLKLKNSLCPKPFQKLVENKLDVLYKKYVITAKS